MPHNRGHSGNKDNIWIQLPNFIYEKVIFTSKITKLSAKWKSHLAYFLSEPHATFFHCYNQYASCLSEHSLSKNIFIYSNTFYFLSTQASSVWGQKHNKHTLNENCHLFIKWRSHKIHILEENCHWYIKWHSKENTTKSYTIYYYKNFPQKIIFFSIAEGGAKIFGVFRVKNNDFTPKNHIFFQL
jgi:hypothetical protein